MQEREQVFEETPDGVILHQMMGEYAGRFVEIAIAKAPRDEVLDQNGYCWIDADETAIVTPVHRVQVRIHLQ